MTTSNIHPLHPQHRQALFGLAAVFVTQFINFMFINARNIAQPETIAEFNGIAMFSWLMALPALTGSAATLISGKFSDVFGHRKVL